MIRERLYTIDALTQYIRESTTNYVKHTSDSSAIEHDFTLKQRAQKYLQDCYNGDENDKMYVKHMMRRMLLGGNENASENFPAGYHVDENNIDRFINWEQPEAINAYILYLALLLHYKAEYGADALGYIIEKYHFNDLRPRGDEGMGFFIDANDIRAAWRTESLPMSFDDKLEVLLQLVYEETYGNSCLDETLYQNVGDISAGVSGIPDSVAVTAAVDGMPAYKTFWVRYKGCSIHFTFPSFGSYERLMDVAKKTVDFQMKGQFSENEGFKLGYGKDGSRRTAAIPPFGECPAAWIRKFTEQASSNEDLYGGIPGAEVVMSVERALIRGGATIPICGGQGSGKTTKLETLVKYVQNFFSIRVTESEFEARLRWKYPYKNIYTMEANDTTPVSPSQAYNFSLRSAGDVYIIGEARSDNMIINVTRTANRGGRSVMFTFHPKTAAMTIPEIANAMIREKMYTNLKDAVATALNTVKVCIFVSVDMETHKHYYEIFEFVPLPNVVPDDFLCIEDPEQRQVAFMRTMHAYMQTMVSADTFYKTVPIVKYCRDSDSYTMCNTITDALYEELLEKTPLHNERRELMRVFRPTQFLTDTAKDRGFHHLDDAVLEQLIAEFKMDGLYGVRNALEAGLEV